MHQVRASSCCLGAGVEAIEGDGRVERVRLAGGRTIDCAAVLVGVGVAPAHRARRGRRLDVDNGILVDGGLRTSANGILAAGDVANAVPPPVGKRVRVEHWANALTRARSRRAAMLGQDVSYDKIPYFFSDQYDVGMEYAGSTTRSRTSVVVPRRHGRRRVHRLLAARRQLTAGMNVNVWDVSDPIQAMHRLGRDGRPQAARGPGRVRWRRSPRRRRGEEAGSGSAVACERLARPLAVGVALVNRRGEERAGDRAWRDALGRVRPFTR